MIFIIIGCIWGLIVSGIILFVKSGTAKPIEETDVFNNQI